MRRRAWTSAETNTDSGPPMSESADESTQRAQSCHIADQRAHPRRESFLQRLAAFEAQFENIPFLAGFEQVVVAGLDAVDQLALQRLTAVPVFARGDFFNVQLRAVLRH